MLLALTPSTERNNEMSFSQYMQSVSLHTRLTTENVGGAAKMIVGVQYTYEQTFGPEAGIERG
jgi:hypothetical protein